MSIEFFRRDGTPSATSLSHYPGGEYRLSVEVSSAREIALVRGATPEDLVVLAVWSNDVRRMGAWPIGLVPYLPGARADHEDRAAGFDAASYARLLNAAELDRIVCVDPHSPVMPSLLNNCVVVQAADLIEAQLPTDIRDSLAGLIAPDEGAQARVFRVAERLGLPVYQAHKHRDFNSGELSGFTCEPLPESGAFLVVDDICDGGGTFRGLADAADVGRDRLHLWVTHGIFSGRARALTDHFLTITTTDSHPGCSGVPEARVVNLLPHLLEHLDRGDPT